MTAHDDWWFDGDYSECYYAWGHVDKSEFADWVGNQEYPDVPVMVGAEYVEHIWARETEGDQFETSLVDLGDGWKPMTRYQP